ncbi:hypothetical protein Zm00014a_042613 [Zea mays]|uniref:Uncharacterized protein n=1 Tax=Zea mays TaxID=4577 RepID=A0A3L6DWH4_MAIZE|nr:hypothetical protein Zm00014a_042613 [Zea mays]
MESRALPDLPDHSDAPEPRQSPVPLVSGEPFAAGTSAAAPASRREDPGRPSDLRRSTRSGGPDSTRPDLILAASDPAAQATNPSPRLSAR